MRYVIDVSDGRGQPYRRVNGNQGGVFRNHRSALAQARRLASVGYIGGMARVLRLTGSSETDDLATGPRIAWYMRESTRRVIAVIRDVAMQGD